MSFMFNPYPYDDWSALNVPEGIAGTLDAIDGKPSVVLRLAREVHDVVGRNGTCTVLLDGYATAFFDTYACLLQRRLLQEYRQECRLFSIADGYASSQTLQQRFSEYLPQDRKKDPPLLYGRLCKEKEAVFFDSERLKKLQATIEGDGTAVKVVYGNFAAKREMRKRADLVVYLDVIPKDVVLRYRNGEARNIGDGECRTFKETMRRAYYIDFELSLSHKTELIESSAIDWYVASSNDEHTAMLSWKDFSTVCDALVEQPFRCKPVYCEGVWGGYSTTRLRNLPQAMKNCAWVFDLIPSEVSIVVDIDNVLVDIPFYTFVRMESKALLGKKSLERFGAYFPVRFNYDDSMHSSGNMSIQCHPGERFIRDTFDELQRQDESYYVVETGFGAKTYLGFQEGTDGEKFLDAVRKSEQQRCPIDYDSYVNSVPSVPGRQFLIPAGTVHSSGRNQVVLEIGSLTVGSYTFKLYDYLRLDLDGTPRPIHSFYGEQVLHFERQTDWVADNLVQEPHIMAEGAGWKEAVVGEHDLMYFSLRRLEFLEEIEQDTAGSFHVLALVDGERVQVEVIDHPERAYVLQYRDIVVVPADVGRYRIVNLGQQPVAIHKTVLK